MVAIIEYEEQYAGDFKKMNLQWIKYTRIKILKT
jgi:hypothetical protein